MHDCLAGYAGPPWPVVFRHSQSGRSGADRHGQIGSMKTFLLHFFTWWNGETIGTRFWTWRKGELVGEDEQGNHYYRERNGTRRWVIYNGLVEASTHPGRLAFVDALPGRRSAGSLRAARMGRPHQPELTGTARRLSAAGLDPAPRSPHAGASGLRAVDAGRLIPARHGGCAGIAFMSDKNRLTDHPSAAPGRPYSCVGPVVL